MTNRTIRFYGKGFGATPAEMTVTLDGTEIFSGTVVTLDQPLDISTIPTWPDNFYDINFTAELPVLFDGEKPMTVTVTNGTVVVGDITANYLLIANPVFTAEEIAALSDINSSTPQQRLAIRSAKAVPAFTQTDLDIIAGTDQSAKQALYIEHGVATYVGDPTLWADTITNPVDGVDDSRVNVVINGVAQNPSRNPGQNGTWSWPLYEGDVMQCNLKINAGLEP